MPGERAQARRASGCYTECTHASWVEETNAVGREEGVGGVESGGGMRQRPLVRAIHAQLSLDHRTLHLTQPGHEPQGSELSGRAEGAEGGARERQREHVVVIVGQADEDLAQQLGRQQLEAGRDGGLRRYRLLLHGKVRNATCLPAGVFSLSLSLVLSSLASSSSVQRPSPRVSMVVTSRRAAVALPLVFALLYLARENFSGGVAPPSDDRSFAVPARASLSAAAGAAAVLSSSPPPPPVAAVSSASEPRAAIMQVEVSAVSPPPPCNSLACAGRFTEKEPAWAELTFQPGINWKAGGVRGDCVAGELEYIMPKYCSRHRLPRGNWPSEERLERIDVHSADKPKASLAEIVGILPNRTILLMGDSVMEQFYNTLQCFLRREGVELPNDVRSLARLRSRRPCSRRRLSCLHGRRRYALCAASCALLAGAIFALGRRDGAALAHGQAQEASEAAAACRG